MAAVRDVHRCSKDGGGEENIYKKRTPSQRSEDEGKTNDR